MTIISCLFTSVKYELSNNFEKCREAENLRITDAVWYTSEMIQEEAVLLPQDFPDVFLPYLSDCNCFIGTRLSILISKRGLWE